MLDTALNILKKINEEGYVGYIVGGFVRDYLLNIKSLDIDITTNMPEELLANIYNVTESNHSSFKLSLNNYCFEVTNFRKEISYFKQRHPEVELVNTYKEDYIRRDFTINALCFDLNMNLIDFCDGKIHLDLKTLKTIRDENTTFIEDPVRILRAVYFKNKLGFKYDNNTLYSLKENAFHLSVISYKRLFNELSKMCKKFDIYISDIIDLNIHKYIHLEDSINYINRNKINIKDMYDLISIESFLGNDISKWEISSSIKKEIITFTTIAKKVFDKRSIFDNTDEIIFKASDFYKLINKSIDTNKLLSGISIRCVKDIDFDFSMLIKLVDKRKVNIIKTAIIDNILKCNLKNNNDDIIEFAKNYKL